MDLPSGYEYGRVVGRLLIGTGDSADAGELPDARPAAGVRVRFAPTVASRVVPGTPPSPKVLHSTVECSIDATTGDLIGPDKTSAGVWLWTGVWQVSFTGETIAPYLIEVTAAHTADNPLDLFVAEPYVPPAGTTLQVVPVPAGIADGQTLMYANGKWVAADPAAGVDLSAYSTAQQVQQQIAAVKASTVRVYSITDPAYGSGVGQGNAQADTAALLAAHAAAKAAGGGVIYAPAGRYKINQWPTFECTYNGQATLPYALQGDGKSMTIFESYAPGNATSLTATCPQYDLANVPEGAPEWRGFTIDGTHSGGSGIVWQNISSVTFTDIRIANFRNGDAFRFHNRNGWCERVTMQAVEVDRCQIALHYLVTDTGYASYDYCDMSLAVTSDADQHVVVSEVNTSSVGNGSIDRVGTRLKLVANCLAGWSKNDGTLFWIRGFDKWGQDVQVMVNAERGGGSPHPHTALRIDSNEGYFSPDGQVITYGLGNVVTQGAWQCQPTGWVGLPGITGDGLGSPWLTHPQRQRRYMFDLPDAYPQSVTSGQSWKNELPGDVLVTVPVTFTGAGTAAWNVQVWGGLPAGPTIAKGPNGTTVPLTFLHPAGTWARVDVTAGTIGAPVARWI